MMQTIFRCYILDSDRNLELKTRHIFEKQALNDLQRLATEYVQTFAGSEKAQEAKKNYDDKITLDIIEKDHTFGDGYYIFDEPDSRKSIYKKKITLINTAWFGENYKPKVEINRIAEISYTTDKENNSRNYSNNIPIPISPYRSTSKLKQSTVSNKSSQSPSPMIQLSSLAQMAEFISFRNNKENGKQISLKETLNEFNKKSKRALGKQEKQEKQENNKESDEESYSDIPDLVSISVSPLSDENYASLLVDVPKTFGITDDKVEKIPELELTNVPKQEFAINIDETIDKLIADLERVSCGLETLENISDDDMSSYITFTPESKNDNIVLKGDISFDL